MRTILIHAQDQELSTAWATYLSKAGAAVFTSTDSLEAAEIISMVNIDSIIISSDNPATFLFLGRELRSKRRLANIVTVTRIPHATLELLMETRNFVTLDKRFTFSRLREITLDAQTKPEVIQNVFV